MDNFEEKVTAMGDEIEKSFKEGATAFIDDVAQDKHLMNEIADEKKAQKAAKRAAKKEKFENAVAAVVESFKQGVEEFKADTAFNKDSYGEAHKEVKEQKAEKKEAKKAKFDGNVAELRDSIDQGAEEFKADGDVLVSSLKEIAEAAGINIKEDNPVSNMIKAVKESFSEGFDAFKSDTAATKEAFDEVNDEAKAQRAEKKAERKEKFDDAVETAKEAAQEGVEAFKSDAALTKEAFEEASEEVKAQKAAKKEAKREAFDENVEAMKEALK